MNTGRSGRFKKHGTVSKRVFSSPTIPLGNVLTVNTKTLTVINGLLKDMEEINGRIE
jgi:hypothetical protein